MIVRSTSQENQRDCQGDLLLGLISDTHGRLSSAALDALAEVDMIVHAGDIGPQSILMRLEGLAPVIAVRGNNDFDLPLKLVATTTLAGFSVVIAHTPPHLYRALREAQADADALPLLGIHGHTHIPEFLALDGATIVCPGSASYPRVPGGPTVMILRLGEGEVLEQKLIRL